MTPITNNTMTIDSWAEVGIFPPGSSGEYRTQCPVCTPNRKPENQRERDFSIAADREKGYCHHCDLRINIRTEGQGRGRPIALEDFTQISQREKSWTRPQPIAQGHHDALEAFRAQIEERGLDLQVLLDQFDVRFIDTKSGPVMVMPYYNAEGQLINHKYRTLDKRFWMDKDAERGLYNIQEIVGADIAVIVEGEMDVYALEQAGIPFVVSVPDGAPAPNSRNYSSKFDFLDSAQPVLQSLSRIVIAVDNDEPGHHLREELTRRLGEGKIAHVYWPEGIKDANDFLRAHGPQALKEEIRRAEPTPVNGVYTGVDLLNQMLHDYEFGFDRGTPMGFSNLDAIYRPTRGHLTIVTGHAGSGKSTVLDNLLVRLATLRNWPIAYFSPEQQPLVRHQAALIEIWKKKPMFLREGVKPEERMTREEVIDANEFLSELFSFINPEGADINPDLDTILAMATAEVARRGIKGLVIDPWNELEHTRPRHMSETEYVSMALQKIRAWGRQHKVHIWLIAHPTKMQAENGKDAVPGLSNIAGSVHFRNKADYGLTVYRDQQAEDPEQRNIVEVHVTKARWRDSARAGHQANFLYDTKTNTISEYRMVEW